MNHTKEIALFYDWLETNSVSDSAINLWHALMHINSKAGWIPEFAVAISTLSTKTGLKRDAIGTARNRLQQVGRIKFTSRPGQQSALYRMIPFDQGLGLPSEIPTQTPPQNDSDGINDTNPVTNSAQTPSQSAHKQPPLIDLSSSSLDQELKEKDPTTTHDVPYESFFSAYKRVYRKDLTPYQIETLGKYIDDDGIPEDVIVHAIERAGFKGGGIGFVNRILNDYAAGGINTVVAAEAADKLYDEPRNFSKGSYPKVGRSSHGSRKPNLQVVKDKPPENLPSPEELERLRRLAREMKQS